MTFLVVVILILALLLTGELLRAYDMAGTRLSAFLDLIFPTHHDQEH